MLVAAAAADAPPDAAPVCSNKLDCAGSSWPGMIGSSSSDLLRRKIGAGALLNREAASEGVG
jgi:hypothetical protein